LIVTVSPATGTEDPPQVAVLFQLPVTDAVLAAAQAGEALAKRRPAAPRNAISKVEKNFVILVILFLFLFLKILIYFCNFFSSFSPVILAGHRGRCHGRRLGRP
jgi:hypothetical protein